MESTARDQAFCRPCSKLVVLYFLLWLFCFDSYALDFLQYVLRLLMSTMSPHEFHPFHGCVIVGRLSRTRTTIHIKLIILFS
ncbi:hypothetical protein BJV74DRAFT_840703, partial [Russula compacta]